MSNTVCIFGDSVSKGIVLDRDSGRYRIGEGFVQQLSRTLPITVRNFARMGCTVDGGATLLDTHEAAVAQSAFTLLAFGGNDCDYDWQQVSDAPDAAHLPKTPLAHFSDQYKQLIERVRALGSRPVLLNLPPIDGGRYFSHISRARNPQNILRFLSGSCQFIYRWHELYNHALTELARTSGTLLIDIRSGFLRCADLGSLLCDDGIHPNVAGHRLISAQIADFVTPHLAPL